MTGRICEVELLSKIECENVLSGFLGPGHLRLVSYRIEYASDESIGFLGEYFRLLVTAETKNERLENLQFFIKSLPVTEGKQKKLLSESGIFKKEVVLYQTLLKEIASYGSQKWKPNCYYSRSDILVLEDLYTCGYSHIPKNEEFTVKDIKTVLSALSLMHASSLAYERHNDVNIGKKYKDLLFETSVLMDLNWFKAGLEALRDVALLHPQYRSDDSQKFIKNNFMSKVGVVCDMVKPSTKFLNVLCHRDSWGRNVLFKGVAGATTAVLVDFQTCVYCPPAIDALFCIYMNTKVQSRSQIMQECLEWYYESCRTNLKAFGVDCNELFSRESFLESCDALKMAAVLYYGIIVTLIYLPNDILMKIKREDPEKYDYYVNFNRSEIVLDQMNKNEEFRQDMFDAVGELVDLIIP